MTSFDELVAAVVPAELLASVKDVLVGIGFVDTIASQAWEPGWCWLVVVWLSFVVVSSSVVMQNSKLILEPPQRLDD